MGMVFTDYPIRGIDISESNGAVDFDALKKTGASFCIIRAGYGKTTDRSFLLNWKYCKGKMHRGVYWYLDYYSNWYNKKSSVYGISDTEWGKRQAQYLWNLIKNDPGTMVWLDVEDGGADYSPKTNTCWDRVERMIDGFYEEIDKLSGKTQGLYSSYGWLDNYGDHLKHRPLWVAWYNESIALDTIRTSVLSKGWTNLMIWQYASDGDIDGDNTPDGKRYGTQLAALDLNIWLRSTDEYIKFSSNEPLVPSVPIELFNQKDPKWALEKLGTSNYTIGSSGCLITCLAMRLNQLGFNTNPSLINKELTEKGGYESGCNLVFAAPTQYYPITHELILSNVTMAKVNQYIDRQIPVIVQVDYNPSTLAMDQHWVMITGRTENDYIIIDPLGGIETLFSKRYGDPSKNMRRAVIYQKVKEEEMALFKIKILITNLVIRSGPGNSYPVVQRYATGVYDVYEEQNGYYRIGDKRWVSANPAYVQKFHADSLTIEEKVDRLWDAHPSIH